MRIWVLLVALLASGCVHASPTISPGAATAANEIRIVEALDLLRNAAIDANAKTPPLLSTATAKQFVLYHESTILLMQAAPAGWRATAQAALVVVEKNLSPAEQETLGSYLALAHTLLEVLQ